MQFFCDKISDSVVLHKIQLKQVIYLDISTNDILCEQFSIPQDIIEFSQKVEYSIRDQFTSMEMIQEHNQYKVLKAMQKAKLSDTHFNWTTGYGYNDVGREKVEQIYSYVFNTEDAIVRPNIVNGTHALSLCLFGVLRPGDEILSCTSRPYDTLEEVIGIRESAGSLSELGITYKQVEFLEDGNPDIETIKKSISSKTKMAYIQRSKGYSWRKSMSIEDIERIIRAVKEVKKDIIVMVDNCYGEFIETREPTDVGVDIMAGSLIKNPGGGLALTGGYIVGKKDLVEKVSYRLTCPGIGKECGLTFGVTRNVLQGLFLAPYTVCQALKGAVFCSKFFEELGYEVLPKPTENRSDIIQSIKLGTEKDVVSFCKGIQAAAPVDSFVSPEPWDMPGYDSKVIMAAGAFIQGSSIELSADAPIKPPYIVYFQGGLTYTHSKFGTINAYAQMMRDK